MVPPGAVTPTLAYLYPEILLVDVPIVVPASGGWRQLAGVVRIAEVQFRERSRAGPNRKSWKV